MSSRSATWSTTYTSAAPRSSALYAASRPIVPAPNTATVHPGCMNASSVACHPATNASASSTKSSSSSSSGEPGTRMQLASANGTRSSSAWAPPVGAQARVPVGGTEAARPRPQARGGVTRTQLKHIPQYRQPSAHAPRPELHADPRPDRLGRLGYGVLPGALAAAAHDQQIPIPDLEPQRRATASRPQRQDPWRAQRHDRDHGVLSLAAPDRVPVPRDAVSPVPVQAQPRRQERLAELGAVVRRQPPPPRGHPSAAPPPAAAPSRPERRTPPPIPPATPGRNPPRPRGPAASAAPSPRARRGPDRRRPCPAAIPGLKHSCEQSIAHPNAYSSAAGRAPRPSHEMSPSFCSRCLSASSR